MAKNKLWNFKTDDDLLDRLKRAAVATGRPAAQITRESIAEKLDELAEEFPEIDAPDDVAAEPATA